jgi:heptosyltransferase-3
MRFSRHAIRDAVVQQVLPLLPDRRVPAGDSILVIQPDHLGDILLSQPAVRLLRSRFPDKRLVAIVGSWSEGIARRTWPIDELHTFSFPAFDRGREKANPFEPYRMLEDAANLIAGIRPGAVYILRPDDWWSALAASLSTEARIITATDYGTSGPVDIPDRLHATERAATIAAEGRLFPLTSLSMPIDPQSRTLAWNLLAAHGIRNDYVVIHPGSGADVKLWPASRWSAIARALIEDGTAAVITGSPAEAPLAASVVDGVQGAVNLAGATSLDVLIEILRGATVVAGPDCGPLHIAVACETPTVHLFGPSSPERFGPWGDRDRHRVVTAGWLCPCCGDLSPARAPGCGCMLAIDTDTVLQTIREMTAKHGTH